MSLILDYFVQLLQGQACRRKNV